MTIAWDPLSDPAITSYKVYTGTASGQYSTATNVGNTSTSTVSNLVQGLTYFIAVSGVSSSGETDLSSELVFKVNSAPVLGSVGGLPWGTGGTQQLLANGSFESKTTGWTASGNLSVKAGGGAILATDGSYYVAFNGGNTTPNGVLSQTGATVPGQAYGLSLDLGVFAYNQNEQRLQVTAQGSGTLVNQTASVFGLGGGQAQWVHQSYGFVADSPTVTITLKDVSPTTASLDMLLDNVCLVQTSDGNPILTVAAGYTLSAPLAATDPDVPAQTLTYSIVSGPSGATVSSGGMFSWTPSSTQGPSTNLVTVRVTDNGVPPLSDAESFKVIVTAPSLRIARRSLPTAQPAARPAHTCVVQRDGRILLQMQGTPDVSFTVEASSDLENWSPIGRADADQDGRVRYTDTAAGDQAARFYRLSEH